MEDISQHILGVEGANLIRVELADSSSKLTVLSVNMSCRIWRSWENNYAKTFEI